MQSVGSLIGEASSFAGGLKETGQSVAQRLGLTASYFKQLRPAFYRGIPFKSLGTTAEFGRRQELHEYPNRDTPWVEDLGRSARRFDVIGFLIGDDVIQQREEMISAVETEGSATLSHPSYGEIHVALMSFKIIEVWDKGRYFELHFSFVESGERVFPASITNTQNLIEVAGKQVSSAAAAQFVIDATKSIEHYANSAQGAIAVAAAWRSTLTGLARDARNIAQATGTMIGSFGRYVGQSASRLSNNQAMSIAPATVEDALTAATARRMAVEAAALTMEDAAIALDKETLSAFSSAAQSAIESVRTNSIDPGNAIRTLSSIAGVNLPVADLAMPSQLSLIESAANSLIRNAVLSSISIAASQYKPESQDDAVKIRNQVTAWIDAGIDVAGDAGQDDLYSALRALRMAIVKDLNSRGAALPSLRNFEFGASMPSLFLANRMYRDAGRSDDLIAQVDPIHPAFMPLTFTALAK